jgi:hypothetical protein
MAHIELDRLLGCSVDELIALVQSMSADNCEQYARAILGRIGGPSFEQLMTRIIQTAAPKDGGPPPRDPGTYYFAVRELFHHVAEDSDVVGRLVLLTMLGHITAGGAPESDHALNCAFHNRQELSGFREGKNDRVLRDPERSRIGNLWTQYLAHLTEIARDRTVKKVSVDEISRTLASVPRDIGYNYGCNND